MKRQLKLLPLAALVLCAGSAAAQTWKEFSIGAPGERNQTRFGREGLQSEGITLKRAISRAFGVPEYRVDGPGWLDSQRYAITALVSNPADFQPLFQQELSRRFFMLSHWENKEVPVYVLQSIPGTQAKIGQSCAGLPEFGKGAPSIRTAKASLDSFSGFLSETAPRPVVNESAVEGSFDICLAGDIRSDSGLRAAVRDQLGLQLADGKKTMQFLVVDHIEKPALQ
jgi:uncharacterized protein (TIGR03435 family)